MSKRLRTSAYAHPLPDGLTYAELRDVLAPLLASGRVAGMQVTVYDLTLDPAAEAGGPLVDALVSALRSAAAA